MKDAVINKSVGKGVAYGAIAAAIAAPLVALLIQAQPALADFEIVLFGLVAGVVDGILVILKKLVIKESKEESA